MDLVQPVADVEVAVGVGRAVVEREGFTAFGFAQAVVNADLFPVFQPGGFAFRQSRAHRETRFRGRFSVSFTGMAWSARLLKHLFPAAQTSAGRVIRMTDARCRMGGGIRRPVQGGKARRRAFTGFAKPVPRWPL